VKYGKESDKANIQKIIETEKKSHGGFFKRAKNASIWKRLFENRRRLSNIDMPAPLVLVCPKCRQRYAIGEDSVVQTDESMWEGLSKMAAIVIGGPNPERRGSDVVMYGGALHRDVKRENLQRAQSIREALHRGERRTWSCCKCDARGLGYAGF
jgi:hypothetical protein